MNGAIAYPATLSSFYLLGYSDSFISHQTKGHNYGMFADALLGDEDSFEDRIEATDGECTNYYTDYTERGDRLSHVSPDQFTISYQKKKNGKKKDE